MATEERRDIHSERGFELIGWLLTVGLGLVTARMNGSLLPDQRVWLFAIVGAFALVTLLYYRIMPPSSEEPVRYGAEDKALVVSVTMIFLLTAYFYVLIEPPPGLMFLYFLPMFVGALILHERVVLGEAAAAAVGMLFIRASFWQNGPFFTVSFTIQLAVFVAAIIALAALTRALRLAFEKTRRLSVELSRRLDQIQVIGVLVKQSELFTQLDRLLKRATEIVADAIGAEIGGVFIHEPSRNQLVLRKESVGLSARELERLGVEENIRVFNAVFVSGDSKLIGKEELERQLAGSDYLRELMIVPLRAGDASIGVMFAANKRGGVFVQEDLNYCELLTGFVATLVDSSLSLQKVQDERKNADRMMRLMVGRELRMRELKEKLRDSKGYEIPD